MRMIEYAWQEFQGAGWCDENHIFTNEMQEAICRDIIELLEVLGNQGHSGTSHSYLISLLLQLSNFNPITPLTGSDDEWQQVDSEMFQNKRCSSVFKDASRYGGKPYYLYGTIFWEWAKGESGDLYKDYFTNSDSLEVIEFPWIPPREQKYQFRPSEEYPYEEIHHETSANEHVKAL